MKNSDAYAKRKVVRRLALPLLVFSVAAAAASPAWAKKITDEELMSFLNSPTAPAVSSKAADPRPAAAAAAPADVLNDDSPALKEDEKVEKSKVVGVVSAISKQGIALEYSKSKSGSKEMYLPFTRSVKVTNIDSLDLLRAGDEVRVQFERVYMERPLKDAKGKDRDKKEKIILRSTVTGIDFMNRPLADTLKSMEGEA